MNTDGRWLIQGQAPNRHRFCCETYAHDMFMSLGAYRETTERHYPNPGLLHESKTQLLRPSFKRGTGYPIRHRFACRHGYGYGYLFL
jgi:hypothetical protein